MWCAIEQSKIDSYVQTVESTNPLTTEEHNFLDHIEQKIHQTAAENAERARQRQVSLSSFYRLSNELICGIRYVLYVRVLWNVIQIQHEKDMKALHERLERERIEREKKHAQQQADLQAQLAQQLAPLRRPCFPFCN